MLEALTINNISGSDALAWIVFFFVIIYSIMGHLLLYSFEKKNKDLRDSFKGDPSELAESQIAQYHLIIKGINKQIPHLEAETLIFNLFQDLMGEELLGVHLLCDF